MALAKKTYTDLVTVIPADNLNDIQDSIIALENSKTADEVIIANLRTDVDENTDSIGSLSDLTTESKTDLVSAINEAASSGGGLTDDVKVALLNCFEKVAWTVDNGQDYVDALEEAFSSHGRLLSISAVYTQSGAVYTTDSLDSLMADLIVTARYEDSSTSTVYAYTLLGTLTEGTSTITVSYGGAIATFDVTVTAWTLEWDYTDGGLPSSVAPNNWTTTEDAPSYHNFSFENNNGIKFGGKGANSRGGATIVPTNYQQTENGIMEIIVNFESYDATLNVRATLNTASDTLIGFLFKDGVKVNGGAYSFLPNTSIELNTDHTLRVERTVSSGKVYLDGVLVYAGELRTLSGTNNVLVCFKDGTVNTTAAVYIKAIRFLHIA